MKLNVDDLVEQGLVKKKTYTQGVYKGLSVLKYTRKVFFKNLWHLDERLLECRGTVVDEEDNVIVLPFKKVFNLHENGTEVELDRIVEIPTKVNGFMAAVTNTEKYGLIVSTTGTLDSEYAKLARKHVPYTILNTKFTYLFEVCDSSDPHIVEEEEGAYLIGARNLDTGVLLNEEVLDRISPKRPKVTTKVFSKVLEDIKTVKHEGFMVRDAATGEVLAKCKSPYYLVKKALLRMGSKRESIMFNHPEDFKQQIDEEYYDLHKYIIDTYTLEEYISFTQEERRTIFEEYYYE